jgi:hypothetical protein
MGTQRIRVRDPLTGRDINMDKDFGEAQVYTGGAAHAAQSAPASNVGYMTPVLTGAVPNLKHLSGGRAQSKKFHIK